MSERNPRGQIGGVNISGSVGSVGGDIVGGNKIVDVPSAAQLDDTLRPVLDAIREVSIRGSPKPRRSLWR
jgi:hypothetical protein